MGKTKNIGGIEFRASRGLTFPKKPSKLNQCVGDLMKGQEFDGRSGVQQGLVESMYKCGADLKPETIKKYGIKTTPVRKAPAKK